MNPSTRDSCGTDANDLERAPLVEHQYLSPLESIKLACWPFSILKTVVLILSFLILILFWVVDVTGECPPVSRMMGVALITALWWVTQIAPLHISAMIPPILLPIMGVASSSEQAASFWNNTSFLFLGGFLFSLALQQSRLHKRIALMVMCPLVRFGGIGLMIGFMLTNFLLSMWMSNTASTLTMMPIAEVSLASLTQHCGEETAEKMRLPLLLGLCYSGTIGGMATLVGTPPNLIYADQLMVLFPEAPPVRFVDWLGYGLPYSFALLWFLIGWFIIKFLRTKTQVGRQMKTALTEELDKLGPMSYEEKVVAVTFAVLMIGWLFRSDNGPIKGWSNLLSHPSYVGDGTWAMICTVPLFLIPSTKIEAKSSKNKAILDWDDIKASFPFDIILLFGGGFALADGFSRSGLTAWIGTRLSSLSEVPLFFLVMIICTVTASLSEVLSNMATAIVLLPLVGALAVSVEVDPRLFMLTVCFASSFAFMLPMATGPNMVTYATGKVKVHEMALSGFVLNIMGIVLWTVAAFTFVPPSAGYKINEMPYWANARAPFVCPSR
eukprot:NODE_1707_length_1841_cov_32.591967_g1448_i0.p1 GENE.NODE_1707_length_1841_cov_32.591967_g1448_i0~~NODE_1707_length_1841_cov_32.591967_g1448_i0.p1  ORF type:complete len:553 (-),score=94.83 NODE_1707_length_1841_cov_32.591967_g1448_i0:120-1778(-)